MLIKDVISAIESFAPPSLQESWDNTGLQTGDPEAECTGALVCLDPTEEVVAEAVRRGCNLVVSHHPLLFHGLKHITGTTPVERTVISAIRAGVAVYSSHTALDSTRGGVSYAIARNLGASVESVLHPAPAGHAPGEGLGVIAVLPEPLPVADFAARVKKACGAEMLRCTEPASGLAISRVAICGGAGGEFIPEAVAAGADAYLTADVRYHDFGEWADRIFLVDAGHYETESCTKMLFMQLIKEKFANFAVYISATEKNPINYL